MLYNNHICKVQSQHFPLMEAEYLKTEIQKSPCSLLMTLHDMFCQNNELCQMFATETYNLFLSQGRCMEDDWVLRYELLATYGVLLSNPVLGYDCKTGGMAIYTSSIALLQLLAQKGYLKGKKQPIPIELELLQKQMYDSDRIRKAIRGTDEKVVCARLDTEIKDGRLVMTVTIPRTMPTLQSHMFIPFTAYQKAVEVLRKEMQMHILRFKMGDKVRDVTLNDGVLSSIYGADRARQLTSYVPDIYTQRFYVPNVGVSKYLPGVTNIKLENVDEIRPISLADVDLSEVNMDYSMVHDFFKGQMLTADSKKFAMICDTIVADFKNVPRKEMEDRLIEETSKMLSSDLWKLMKEYNGIYHTENYKNVRNKYGDLYEYVPIPKTTAEMQELLKSGVFKVLITKRNGSFSTIYTTNDDVKIEALLGSRYMSFESEGGRLRALRYHLTHEKDADVESLISHYYLREWIWGTGGDKDLAIQMIDERLYEIAKVKTVVKQPTLVTVRSLEAVSKETYYKAIDLKSVVEIIRLS